MTSNHGLWPECKLSTTYLFVVLMYPCSHLMITESMLSVYKQADGIRAADQADFAFYALVTVSAIRVHHNTEEEHYRTYLHLNFLHSLQAPQCPVCNRNLFVVYLITCSF